MARVVEGYTWSYLTQKKLPFLAFYNAQRQFILFKEK